MDTLDKILKARKTPDAPAHLSAQIIAAAARTPQTVADTAVGAAGLKGWIADLQSMLFIPKPAYALAVALLIGFSLGLSGEMFSLLPGVTTDELSSFMLIEDRFVASEFTGAQW